jgi:hypothetical protein
MEMTSAKAKLVGPEDLETSPDTVTATVPREEIEAVLASEEPADLVLEVARANGDPAEAERQTVSVAWERDDLERLLGDTSGLAVTFSFRKDELEQAIDPEFEGHGLRERALVLTVAAAAAAGAASASVASASPEVAGLSTSGSAIEAVHNEAIAAARTGPAVAPATEPAQVVPYLSQGQGVDESQFSGVTPPATEPAQVVPYLSQGQGVDESQFSGAATGPAPVHDEAIAAARQMAPDSPTSHDEAGLAARGIQATPTHDEAGLAARGIESQPTPGPAIDEVGLAARGIETGAVHDEATLTARGIEVDPTAVHDEATLVDRGIEAPVADTGSGFELPSVDPGTAAVVGGAAGGAALLITAAAFAARRRPPVTPA